MLFLPRTLIKPPSATRRALRKGENLQCAWTESSVGLSVGVKGFAFHTALSTQAELTPGLAVLTPPHSDEMTGTSRVSLPVSNL